MKVAIPLKFIIVAGITLFLSGFTFVSEFTIFNKTLKVNIDHKKSKYVDIFFDHCKKLGKKYTNPELYKEKFEQFMNTIKNIELQNKVQNASFILGLNDFSDANDTEYIEMSSDSFVYEYENNQQNTISWQELIDKQHLTNQKITIQTLQKLIDSDYFSKIKAFDQSFDKKSHSLMVRQVLDQLKKKEKQKVNGKDIKNLNDNQSQIQSDINTTIKQNSTDDKIVDFKRMNATERKEWKLKNIDINSIDNIKTQESQKVDKQISDADLKNPKSNKNQKLKNIDQQNLKIKNDSQSEVEQFINQTRKEKISENLQGQSLLILKKKPKVILQNDTSQGFLQNKNETQEIEPNELIDKEMDLEYIDILNWNESGVIGKQREQGKCQASWAIVAASCIESAISIKNQIDVSLSEQQLIDCTNQSPYISKGCKGGNIIDAYEYATQNSIQSSSRYPWAEKTQKCQIQQQIELLSHNKISDFKKLNANIESILLALNFGPISAQVDASSQVFRNYKQGIMNELSQCGQRQEHSVMIVGYGYEKRTDQPYLIFQNSWGKSWGENGFSRILISRNQEYSNGMCGIYKNAYLVFA